MFVKIGNYCDWWGPYQIAEALCFWVKKEKDEHGFARKPDWVHDFGTWLAEDRKGNDSWLTRVCQWVDSKKQRKIKVKIDRWDTWGMEHTLALIILPMLQQVKKNKYSAPYTDDEDVPEHLRSTAAPPKENEWDIDENHFKRHEWLLDELIWTFDSLVNHAEIEETFYSGEADYLSQPLDKDIKPIGEPTKFTSKVKNPDIKFYQMVHGPAHTLVHDKAAHDAFEARIQNGLRLFGKYFRQLGD